VAANESETGAKPRTLNYWRLWLVNAVLVSAGVWLYLAAQYGTAEFFGAACLMALLPFIPVMVLVSGAGSTIYVLTKVMIERRSLRAPAALALLVGPGVLLFLACVLLAAGQSPARRLAYICHGNVPASASHVRVAGFSTYLDEQWLAVFNVQAGDFQTMATRAGLAPADGFEFNLVLEHSSVRKSRLFASVPRSGNLPCFKRVFKPGEEHERGSIYAVFDGATSTAAVIREYRD
jgi:hypothetical protein